MDAVQYCEILEDGVVESFEKLKVVKEKRIFQQDNDSTHCTSKKATKWFEDNNIQVLAWPAQFPDINPIEHLWVHLKKRLRNIQHHQRGFMNCGREWQKSETKLLQKHSKDL